MKYLKILGYGMLWFLGIALFQSFSPYSYINCINIMSVQSTQILIFTFGYIFLVDYYKKNLNTIFSILASYITALFLSSIGGVIIGFIYC